MKQKLLSLRRFFKIFYLRIKGSLLNLSLYILISAGTVAWLVTHTGVNADEFQNGFVLVMGCVAFAVVDPIGSYFYYSKQYNDDY
jgi:hypothetical protein